MAETAKVAGIQTFEDGEGGRLYMITFPIYSQLSPTQIDVGTKKVDPAAEAKAVKELEDEVANRKAFLAALAKLKPGYTPEPTIDVPARILGGQ